MALYKDGSFITDRWRLLAEGEDVPPSGHVILPLDWWLAEREAFVDSHAALGVLIEPGTRIDDFAVDIPRLALIALDFPKFGDGRAFSTAALLRTRYGFGGELRAVGEVLFDQIQHMQRCGFDAFEITSEATERALRAGKKPGVAHFYQPARGPLEAPAGTRPWLRRPAV
jgi:uncharacterized protein (DUF934 family)